MYPVVDNSPCFQRLVAGGDDVDLAAVALEIARDAYPALNSPHYLGLIERMAQRIRGRLEPKAERWLTIEAIRHELFEAQDFHGNEKNYYDPRNSYLNEVLERRVGIPITLSILYIAVARRVGLSVSGVNLPAHFIVRTEVDDEPLFIDPFHSGRTLDRDDIRQLVSKALQKRVTLAQRQLEPSPPRALITRMLQNLKLIYLRSRQFDTAIPVLKRLALANRESPEELRDLGIICFYEQRRAESLGYLLEYLRVAPTADDAEEIRLLLRSAGMP